MERVRLRALPSVAYPIVADSFCSSLSVIADSPSPIVVVLSGSMEPAFQRGDLLVLCTICYRFFVKALD